MADWRRARIAQGQSSLVRNKVGPSQRSCAPSVLVGGLLAIAGVADPAGWPGSTPSASTSTSGGPAGSGRRTGPSPAMVDLTRDEHGVLHARLLDVVPGRSGTAYAGWLKAQPEAFTAGIKHAALDPFRGYANALRDELPDAVAVLDAFHVVKLGTNVVDEVRRRVQQDTLARRGHKDDPLYKIRGLLRRGRDTCPTSRSPD